MAGSFDRKKFDYSAAAAQLYDEGECRDPDEIYEYTTEQGLAKRMIYHFEYYVDICVDAGKMEHAHPLGHFSDLPDDDNLLPEECTEEDLWDIFEDPEAVSDELFCSFYYYSLIVLSQIPDILDQYKSFSEESQNLRNKIEAAADLSE